MKERKSLFILIFLIILVFSPLAGSTDILLAGEGGSGSEGAVVAPTVPALPPSEVSNRWHADISVMPRFGPVSWLAIILCCFPSRFPSG